MVKLTATTVAVLMLFVVGCTKKPVSVAIGGGAWLSKNGGQSDILRGLQVYLCKSDSPLKTEISILIDAQTKTIVQEKLRKEQVDAFVAKCKAEHDALAKQHDEQVADEYKKLNEQLDVLLQSKMPGRSREAKQMDHDCEVRVAALKKKQQAEVRQLKERQEQAMKSLKSSDNVNVAEFEKKARYEAITKAVETGETSKIAAKYSVSKATTNIDGKYTLNAVPPGSYVLYAEFTNAFSAGYWLVPITISDSEQQPQLNMDLQNDNLSLGANHEQ